LALSVWPVVATAIAFSANAAPPEKCPNRNDIPTKATLDEARDAVLCLVNQERDERGKRPLNENQALTRAAGIHSRDMVERRYFDHNSPSGRDVVDRVMAARWTSRNSAWSVGENIAWGTGDYATPRRIVNGWMNSPGHRQNILGKFREAGVGVAVGNPRGRRGATYTLDFGTRG
jgi:uncharacterized protein YkwD